MHKLLSTALFVPVVWFACLPVGSAHAQMNRPSLDTSRNELQTAVCLNDWADALAIINPMIGSSEITAGYREELIRFRRQIQTWRDAQADLSNRAPCASIVAEAEADAAAEAAAREETFQAAETARQRAIASQAERQAATVSVAAQCSELAGVIEWGTAEFETIDAQANYSELSSIMNTLSRFDGALGAVVTRLQTLSITDAQLLSYQQSFVSTYQSMRSAVRWASDSMRSALQSGSIEALERTADALDRQADQFDQLTLREETLINQMSAYCGSNPF
ncbi:MAG: hypothetical protein VKL39_05485 [Leptolyngbyaceae bacterium]|nr:hypothetical protein [Leptolyngbyaceae bacterium]